MPVGNHGTWNIDEPAADSQGSSSNASRLRRAYPSAPYQASADNAVRRATVLADFSGRLNPEVTDANPNPSIDGFLVNGYSMNWSSNMPALQHANPTADNPNPQIGTSDSTRRFTPNLNSPGPNGTQPAMTNEDAPRPNAQFGDGEGHKLAPRAASDEISGRDFGALTLPSLAGPH